MPESLVAPLRQRFRAKRPTRGVGTLAGAWRFPEGPAAAGPNRRGLRTPRPKLSTGQPHARHPWRGAPVVYARGTASDARRIAEFTWCPASLRDSPRGQWCSPSGLPTVGGERVHGSCVVASQPPATAGWWPPTFATMMHRPCDASRCFQTDRFGQRVP